MTHEGGHNASEVNLDTAPSSAYALAHLTRGNRILLAQQLGGFNNEEEEDEFNLLPTTPQAICLSQRIKRYRRTLARSRAYEPSSQTDHVCGATGEIIRHPRP